LPRRLEGGGVETSWSFCVGLPRRLEGGAYKPVTDPTIPPKFSDQAQNKQKRSTILGWPLRFSKSKAGSFAHFLISDLKVKNQRISPEVAYKHVTDPTIPPIFSDLGSE